MHHYLNTLDHEPYLQPEDVDSWILFTGVDGKAFDHYFLHSLDERIMRSWSSYCYHHKFILARRITTAHELAVIKFDRAIYQAIIPMGLRDQLDNLARAVRGDSYYGRKSPDSQFTPVTPLPPPYSRQWPSLVLKVAHSEAKLQSDVRYWLDTPGSEANVVSTLQIERLMPQITIQKWTLRMGRKYLDQSITITKQTKTRIQFRPKGHLVINFRELFLRDPCYRETNINLDEGGLTMIAGAVWRHQEF